MSDKILEDVNVELHDSPGVLPNEKDFTQGAGDSYAIYQLKAVPENHLLRFASFSELDQPVRKENYDLVYTGPLPDGKEVGDHAILEDLHGKITIRDLNSRYGTFVNERKLGEFPITLETGAEIRLGSRTKLYYTRMGSPVSRSGEAITVDKLPLLSDVLPPENKIPAAGRPSDDTLKTNTLKGGTGDETVRVNLIGGSSRHRFGEKK